jgi:hypothetical protein
MYAFRIVVRVLGLVAMVYLAMSGFSGSLESWMGGVGWAALACFTMVSFYTQSKYEENTKILIGIIEALQPKEEEGDNDES